VAASCGVARRIGSLAAAGAARSRRRSKSTSGPKPGAVAARLGVTETKVRAGLAHHGIPIRRPGRPAQLATGPAGR
jgi:hypothetical protein